MLLSFSEDRSGRLRAVVLEAVSGRGPCRKRRAAILARAVDSDAAAVQLDDLPDEREAQPETAVAAARRRIGLAEPIEDVGQESGAMP